MRLYVLPLLKHIPAGQISTYGDIARFLGVPNNSRQIGYLLGSNQEPDDYPCYKVVASDGTLGGYSTLRGLEEKQERLEKDGMKVAESRLLNFKKVRWQPKLYAYFLGLPLDENNRKVFEEACQRVTKLLPRSGIVSFQNLELPHITLHYFGDISPEEGEGVVTKMRSWEENYKGKNKQSAVRLKFQGLDFFGRSGRRTVGFFECVENKKEGIQFQEEFGKILNVPTDRPFVPHLTFFRVKDPAQFAKFEKKIQETVQDLVFEVGFIPVRLYSAVDDRRQVPLADFEIP